MHVVLKTCFLAIGSRLWIKENSHYLENISLKGLKFNEFLFQAQRRLTLPLLWNIYVISECKWLKQRQVFGRIPLIKSHDILKEHILQHFPVFLKQKLHNYLKILKKCFFVTNKNDCTCMWIKVQFSTSLKDVSSIVHHQ